MNRSNSFDFIGKLKQFANEVKSYTFGFIRKSLTPSKIQQTGKQLIQIQPLQNKKLPIVNRRKLLKIEKKRKQYSIYKKQEQKSQVQVIQISDDQQYFEEQNFPGRFKQYLSVCDEIIKRSKKIQIIKMKLQQIQSLINKQNNIIQNKTIIQQNNYISKITKQQHQMKLWYQNKIRSILITKYQYEKLDYPFFSFNQVQNILKIWKRKDTEIIVQHQYLKQVISYKNISTLAYENWLNDQIINAYIRLINIRLNSKDLVIVNTFFINSLHSSNFDQKKIDKILNRLGVVFFYQIQLSNNLKIVIPINHKNIHWSFIVLDDKIKIFDSMRGSYPDNVIIEFYSKILNRNPQFYIQNFPQQSNFYDCGVFTLCGIKDYVRGKQWTFNGQQMMYKRIQITIQLLKGNLYW